MCIKNIKTLENVDEDIHHQIRMTKKYKYYTIGYLMLNLTTMKFFYLKSFSKPHLIFPNYHRKQKDTMFKKFFIQVKVHLI